MVCFVQWKTPSPFCPGNVIYGGPIPVAARIAKKVGVGVMRNGDQRRERGRGGDGARVRETIQKEGAADDEEAKKVSNC